MTSTTRSVLFAAVAASLLLAGCAPTASAPGADKPAGDGGGSGGSGADCSSLAGLTDPELKLFSSSAIAKGPTEGQTYGDGTVLAITLSQEALDAGLLPQYAILTPSDSGAPVFVENANFDPTTGGDGTFSTISAIYGSDELVGKAVVLSVFAISSDKVGDAEPYGDKLMLGNFCMTLANDDS